jgi:pyrroloquinoline-quinone synthase
MTEFSETVSSRCDKIIDKHNLLSHTFYRRWTDGTLPVPALKDYAGEYGHFIRSIRKGWETLGKSDIAKAEGHHAQIWENTFAQSLGTTVSAPRVTETVALIATSDELFAEPITALGALYAFEAQQPIVSQAKLKGLRENYQQLPEQCGEYFRLHCEDYGETEFLTEALNALNADEREIAVAACERMGLALYDALTGIEAPYLEQ